MPALKILKDGNRITYILVREKENIPLVSVENGEIRVVQNRIPDLEIFYSLIAALKVAVLKFMKKDEGYWRRCEIDKRFWQFMKEHDFISAKEALRQDE